MGNVRLRKKKREQHKLTVVLAAEEKPPQRHFSIRTLQNAVVVSSSGAVKMRFQPIAPTRVVGEDKTWQISVQLSLKRLLRELLSVDRHVQALLPAFRIRLDVNGS